VQVLKLGIIGNPLGHSLSPVLHEFLIQKSGHTGSYKKYPAEFENLASRLTMLRESKLLGLNVTIPFKEEVLNLVDVQSSEVSAIGAANTLLFEENQIKAFNTDVSGFLLSLERNQVRVAGKQVVVLGAGGAAKAILYGLSILKPTQIILANRSVNRAAKLAERMQSCFETASILVQNLDEKVLDYLQIDSILINTTSLGMCPEIKSTPLAFRELPESTIVVDLVYNPLETKFLKLAKHAGAKTIDGLDMLAFQGIKAFEIWLRQEIKIDYSELRKLLEKRLKNG